MGRETVRKGKDPERGGAEMAGEVNVNPNNTSLSHSGRMMFSSFMVCCLILFKIKFYFHL